MKLVRPGQPCSMDTHIFPDNRAKTLDPEQSFPNKLRYPETFSGKPSFQKVLELLVVIHTPRRGQETISSNLPFLTAVEPQDSDITQNRRGKKKFAGAFEQRFSQTAPADELFPGDVDFASELYGRGHGDHCTCSETVSGVSLGEDGFLWRSIPGLTFNGHWCASWMVRREFESRWLIR